MWTPYKNTACQNFMSNSACHSYAMSKLRQNNSESTKNISLI